MSRVVLMPGGFGAFGKIPALGDFFRTGVAADFVAAWDPWLQGILVAARAASGPAWTERYMSAPIWRFALAPGLAGRGAVAGVMMPSVDRVGRQFPLTLVAAVPTEAALRTLIALDPVLDRLEHIALDALDDDMTPERLAARLAEVVPVWPLPASVHRGGRLMAGATVTGLVVEMALGQGPGAASVWSATVAGAARLIASDGLPGADMAAALFDLDAAEWVAA